MQLTKYSILCCVGKVIEAHGQNYSYASTKTLLELLQKYHRIKICKRTYYQHMRDLRDEGLIKSIRRYGRELDGKIYNRTSAVCITIKGYVLLALRGWKWALNMAKRLRQKIIPTKTTPKTEMVISNRIEEKKEEASLKDVILQARKESKTLYQYLLDVDLSFKGT